MYVGDSVDYDAATGGVDFYDLLVRAEDYGATPLYVDGTMRVSLTGVNDNPPSMDFPLDVVVSEAAVSGDVVVKVNVTDYDGDSTALSVGGPYANLFFISGNQILLQSPLDYDNKTNACLGLEVQ